MVVLKANWTSKQSIEEQMNQMKNENKIDSR